MKRPLLVVLIAYVCLAGMAAAAPGASLTSSTSSGNAPLLVLFTYECSADANTTVTSCSLKFGDTNTVNLSPFSGTIPHTYAGAGIYDANLTTVDSNNARISAIKTITVNAAVNNPPVISGLPDKNMLETNTTGIPDAFDLDNFASDPEGSPLTFSITNQSGCSSILDSNVAIDAQKNIDIPKPKAVGSCNVTVRVSDGNLTANDTFAIAVFSAPPSNQAPIASSVSISPSSPHPGDDLSCSFTYSDADGDAAGAHIFTWFVNGGTISSGTSAVLDDSLLALNDSVICQVRPLAATGASPGGDVNSSAVSVSSVSLGTPSVSSSSHSNSDTFYADDTAEFSWSSVSGANGYSFQVTTSDSTTPDSSIDTTSTSLTDGVRADGSYYFHLRACTLGGECGGTAHYRFRIDKTGPGTVSSLGASVTSEGAILIEWNAPSDASGIRDYKIFRDTSSDFNSIISSFTLAEGVQGTNYEDTSATEGRTYFYRIQAFDNAGNSGTISGETSIFLERSCAISITIDVDGETSFQPVGGGSHLFSARASNGNMQLAQLRVKTADSAYTTVANTNNGTEMSGSYSIPSNETGSGSIEVIAEDSSGADCTRRIGFSIDAIDPEGSWIAPQENSTLQEIVPLRVTATDNRSGDSGVQSVDFYYAREGEEFTKLSGVNSSSGNNEYSFSWNTLRVPNDTYTIKAVVIDRAKNSIDLTRTVEVANTLSEEEVAQRELSSAEEAQRGVTITAPEWLGRGIILPSALEDQVVQAGDSLQNAQQQFSSGQYNDAASNAHQAMVWYEELTSAFTVENLGRRTILPGKDLDSLFRAAALEEGVIPEAVQYAGYTQPRREFRIQEVRWKGETQYQASVTITLTNTHSVPLNIKVVELVPKAFAEDASELKSTHPFTIVMQDPVVEYDLGTLEPGENTNIVYVRETPLTREEAEALLGMDWEEEFKIPSIVLNVGTVLEESFQGQQQDLVFLLFIVLGLLVVVLVIVALYGVKVVGIPLPRMKLPKLTRPGQGKRGSEFENSRFFRFTETGKKEAPDTVSKKKYEWNEK